MQNPSVPAEPTVTPTLLACCLAVALVEAQTRCGQDPDGSHATHGLQRSLALLERLGAEIRLTGDDAADAEVRGAAARMRADLARLSPLLARIARAEPRPLL